MKSLVLFSCLYFIFLGNVNSQAPTCSVWEQMVDFNSDNGELQANALTIDQCKAACLAHYTGCQFGFDWSASAQSGRFCWISTNAFVKSAAGITHYNCQTIKPTPAQSSTTTAASSLSTTIPPSATTRAPCTNFSVALSNNSNIQGSIRQSSYTNVNDCLNNCQRTTWCTGIDWNTNVSPDQACWFTIKGTNDIVLNNYPGVFHYHVTCTSSLLPSGCQWKLTNNTNTPGGLVQPSANTLADCQAACINSAGKCTNGFDWNPTNAAGSRCFVSTTSNLNSGSTGIQHYSLDCGAGAQVTTPATGTSAPGASWNVTQNSNSPGGVRKAEAQTLDACKDLCAANFNTICNYGFDWNPAGNQCWFSTNPTVNVNGFQGVDHYVYVPPTAPGGLVCSWTTMADTNSPGGTVQPSATTLDACKKICADLGTGCAFGIDWNPLASSGTQCWLSKSSTKSTFAGVSHLDLNCVNTGGCTWNSVPNTNSPGGILQSTPTTLAQCQAQCITAKDTICRNGFDWNPSNPVGQQCFFSTSTALSTYVGVSHYTYQCSSADGATTILPGLTAQQTGSTSCQWTPRADTNTPGGVLQGLATSLDLCKAQCLAVQTTICSRGFDWNPSSPVGQQCFFSTSTTFGSFTGVTHYDYTCLVPPTTVNTGCTWSQKANTNTPGGLLQGTATSLELCQSQCLSARTTICRNGFDWNPSSTVGQQCYFSTSTNFGIFPGVSHYDPVCTSGGATTGVPNVATTLIPDCTFTPVNDVNSPGGVPQPFDTLDGCKTACVAAKSTSCTFGFDWNPSGTPGSRCWFSTVTTTTTYVGVTHYNINCVQTVSCQHVEIQNSNSPGGTPISNVTTFDQCKSLCIAVLTTSCKFGFDFNPSAPAGNNCFFSTSSTVLVGNYVGVSHYNVTCTGGTNQQTTVVPPGGCAWILADSSKTIGGLIQPSATTLDLCKALCNTNILTNCTFGFDWDVIQAKCYFSVNSNIQGGAPGVQHYTCQSSASTAVVSTPRAQNISAISNCTWTPIANSNTLGGTPSPYNDVATCQYQCALSPNKCIFGFDFNNLEADGKKCWFSVSTSLNNGTVSGITHYVC